MNPSDVTVKFRPFFLCGGDSWALPTVKAFADTVRLEANWNDFSRMNGGFFPPHNSHQKGIDIDGYYGGYQRRGKEAAEKMIALLNAAGSRVTLVLVAFQRAADDPFWKAIKDTPYARIIQPDANHDDHFHWRIRP